jgi:hypothetical protein
MRIDNGERTDEDGTGTGCVVRITGGWNWFRIVSDEGL